MIINWRRSWFVGGIVGLLAAVGQTAPGAGSRRPLRNPPEPGIIVQARGPVHEAFAQPSDVNPQPGPVVPRQPPPPIPEEPPEQRPPGDNVQWLPGYWGWDSDRNDFVWVSGFWRVPPPGRHWVPGHWTEVEGGWQWISGFWTAAAEDSLSYLPSPPASLDVGPSVPAPDENSLYVPGNWIYRLDRYAWQPGFWQDMRPGCIWTPARYCWTPRGDIYVDGYWDRCLEDRGLLFAPVSFDRPLWTTPGWYYQPRFAVGLGGLLGSLFARPYSGHYYFGDYYGAGYDRLGFQPWYQYGPRFHDPLFDYYRWAHRGQPGWYSGLRDTYLARRDGRLARPPHTWADQASLLRQNGNAVRMVKPLSQVRGHRGGLVALNSSQRASQRSAIEQVRRAGVKRGQFESFARSGISESARRTNGFTGGRPSMPASVVTHHASDGHAGLPSIRPRQEGRHGDAKAGAAAERSRHSGPAHEQHVAPHAAAPRHAAAEGKSSHHASGAAQHHAGPHPTPQHQAHSAPARHAAPASHGASHSSGGKHHR